MLQETCRSIGNDIPTRNKDSNNKLSKRSPRSKSGSPVSHKSYKARSPKSSTLMTPRRSIPGPSVPITSPQDSLPSPNTDYNHIAASQYQLLQQQFYQTELEKLQIPPPATINPFLPPSTSYLPEPLKVTPPLPPPVSNTDFAKLAAFFYQRLQQTNPPAPTPMSLKPNNTPTTEALLNYRMLFPEFGGSFFSPPVQPDLPAPVPKPQFHECHWVTADGYCGKKHYSHEDLMLHLKSHVATSTDTPTPTMFSPRSDIRRETTPTFFNPTDYHPRLCRTQTTELPLHPPVRHHPLRYQPYGSLSNRQLSVPF